MIYNSSMSEDRAMSNMDQSSMHCSHCDVYTNTQAHTQAHTHVECAAASLAGLGGQGRRCVGGTPLRRAEEEMGVQLSSFSSSAVHCTALVFT